MTNVLRRGGARSLFNLRTTLAAARAILAFDNAIARPFPGVTISQSELDQALSVCKACAVPLLHTAHEAAIDLLCEMDGRPESELAALVGTIKDHVEWAAQALSRDDRYLAWFIICIAWRISSAALRIFAMEQDRRLHSGTAES